jgi:hypothetical protein
MRAPYTHRHAWIAVAALFGALTLAGTAAAGRFDPFVGPKPLAVLMAEDRQHGFADRDAPLVAIYENGDVIFAKRGNGRSAFHRAKLSTSELAEMAKVWQPLFTTPTNPHYSLSGWTHEPITFLYVRHEERALTLSAYGLSCGNALALGKDNSLLPPSAFLSVVEKLCALDISGSLTWAPQIVEVMLWHGAGPSSQSVAWYRDWPTLNSDRARKRRDGYSIYLDGTQLPKLDALHWDTSVDLNGKSWSVSYRYVFPSEPIWEKAFAAHADKK